MARKKRKKKAKPDPLPEDKYGKRKWAKLIGMGFVWYPKRGVAIYDEGQPGEIIAK